MAEDNESGKAERGRVKEIIDPVRVTIRIEDETHQRLRHAMVVRKEMGISKIVEEACRLWLESESARSTKP